MGWEALKAELEYLKGYFPSRALTEALAQPAEVTPPLLEELARHARDPAALAALDPSYFLHIYALYLLAQLREGRAHADILVLVGQPGEYVFEVFDDLVTGDLYAILARTCGGDVTGIKQLIGSPEANEFVRGAGLRALAAMVAFGEYAREDFVGYARELFRSLPRTRRKEHDALWFDLIFAANNIHPGELIDEIRGALSDGLIDPQSITIGEVDKALAQGVEQALDIHRERDPLDLDAVDRLELWRCFDPEDDEFIEPYVREAPKVGRNDPCPCGSGKKYKKCCLAGST